METDTGRPIPKPRRTILEANKLKYENVVIDLKKRELRICDNDDISNEDNVSKCSKENESTKFNDEADSKCKTTIDNDDDEATNKTVEDKDKCTSVTTAKLPTPAPRIPKKLSHNKEAYENVRNAADQSASSEIETNEKCITYKSLDVPQKKKIDSSDIQRSISPVSPSSTENWGDYNLKKSVSNSTIDSSVSSMSSNDNQKYKNPSPSKLLKNLGTTSKLLTESITERVTTRAKNAKHKLNENIKISQDFLQNLSTDTASRIKSVRKKFNNSNTNDSSSSRHDTDSKSNPKLVLNNQVFNTISFNSPMNRNQLNFDNSSHPDTYEIPKNSSKKVNYINDGENDDCPTFEEAMRNRSYSLKNFQNHPQVKSEPVATYKLKNENDNDDSDRKSISLPMPNYPAPILKQEEHEQNEEDSIYGKVREIKPPVRLKRKNKKQIDENREVSSLSIASNRVTIDSVDFAGLSLDESSSRESKEINTDEGKLTERSSMMSNTSKCQSWTYYDKDEDEAASSPEPIYANQEATYDRLCEMGTNDSEIILSPKSDEDQNNKTGKFKWTKTNEKDVLYEFDPLRKKNVLDYYTNKSNELLLLEHLLLEDNYGTIENDAVIPDETPSPGSSEEDNGSVAGATACASSSSSPPATPTRTYSLRGNRSQRKSDDTDMEPVIQSYLAKADDTNLLDAVTESKSNWFVNCNDIQKPSQIYNPFNKNNQEITKKVTKTITLPKLKNSDDPPPPSYAEAIATSSSATSIPSLFSNNNDIGNMNKQQTPPEQFKPRVKSVLSNVMTKIDGLKRKTSFRTNRPSKDVKVIIEMVPRPTISPDLVRHEGPLIRFPSGVVEDILNEMQNRKAILRDKKFQAYQDQTMKNLKESFPLESITTIQCVSNNKITDNFTHLYCFEITVAIQKNQSSTQLLSNPNMILTSKDSGNCKSQRVCHLYGVGKESERDIWMQKLLESLTSVFPSNYTCQYYRAGWCYLKRSITSPWSGSWILLMRRKRKLLFFSEHEMNLEKVDLRKARCIVLKESDSTIKNLHVENGPILMLDCPPFTLYLIMNFSRETKIWKHIIREVSYNNGPSLNEQQLTKYNVPVIIDKCINFVYIYGSMSEGIYRKSGSENSILKLISLFRVNSFSVEIKRNEYNEHDVANVLKRFMRDLPQKLLSKYSESFCSVLQVKTNLEKILLYKELLNRLSLIEYQTLKKLIGHLSFIASLNSKNKMNIENLAMIWGPTILQNKEEKMSYSQNEADVIAELIILYKDLFVLSADEMKKEQEMLMCLQKYYASGESLSNSIKKSGDLKVWITYIKEEKTQTNVTLTPTKTAYEVCKELSNKINIPAHQLTLFEVILNENLERPLHHDEKVFDIVLRWSYWSDTDRKNNYLVVKKYDFLKEVERALRNLPTVTPGKELKFADNKTKSFKLLNVELRDTIILIQKKDKNLISIVKEISLQNTIPYLGCEKKREISSHSWAITFVPLQIADGNVSIRSKDSPFIGHVIAGTEWKDRMIWFSSIWHCLYGDNVLPNAELVIK